MKTYTTKQGDTWDLIAYQQMGDCKHTKDLMWANRTLLDYYTFPAGIVLSVPDIDEAPADTLPPWKKVSS